MSTTSTHTTNTMNIAEIFGPVLQGEGATSGFPAFFIRLSGCNLMCGGHNGELVRTKAASWWCDTEPLWRQGATWTIEQVIALMKERGEWERILKGTTHVVFTGGEPTLQSNLQAIAAYCDHVSSNYQQSTPYYEIETNGTRYTEGFFNHYIDQINCSPKLKNSGLPKGMRIVKKALQEIAQHKNAWFKFVISDLDDWEEIARDFLPLLDNRRDRIILMPAGSDIEELEVTSKVVWNLAIRENLRACNRLQIITWRKRVGV
ncbi:MAG: 7-carboxy-7-deazaguanine synthase QueE [Oligoflexia bacterium]|nr:7-carboxy-7-deazaguanine synthase QueE [Oligoflexia bacterium]MBF0365057.1 7-carboxy-7-deazaguanine synthase QueE [Oligoflexia bacterium]